MTCADRNEESRSRPTYNEVVGSVPDELAERLADYLEKLRQPELVEFANSRSGVERRRAQLTIRDYIGEVPIGLDLVTRVPILGRRVLEVGAGIGALSVFLHRIGVDVTALEPGANGFDANAKLGEALRVWVGAADLKVLDLEVGQLEPARHGTFDVVFSTNVLEHIPDLDDAFRAMASVLSPQGVMLHLCPNYGVPYEPHFGIPLIPGAPRRTEVLARGLAQNTVWRSLNFVTTGAIRRYAAKWGLEVRFEGGLMARAFTRLEGDETYRDRHPPYVRAFSRILRGTGLLRLVAALPPALATPMLFECRRRLTSPA